MKKGLVFFLGLIMGSILTLGILSVLEASSEENISMFSSPGETLNLRSFEIFQVLPDGSALANSSEKAKSQYPFYSDPVVLFLAEDEVTYYDGQIIEVPSKKVVRQVGTFRYKSKMGMVKTVPIVQLFNK